MLKAIRNLFVASITLVSTFSVAFANDYRYVVQFDGDFSAAQREAFNSMVKSVSNGTTDPNSLNVNIQSLIKSEDISEEGDKYIVTFDSGKIGRLINNGTIVVWRGFKQPLVAWLVKGDSSSSEEMHFVTDPKDNFYNALRNVGSKNKVNLLLPVFDLDDIGAMSISDVMQPNTSKTGVASQRYSSGYAVNGIVVVKDGNAVQFTYHMIDVANNIEIINNTLTGSPSQVAVLFYDDLKKNANVFDRASSQATNSETSNTSTASIPEEDFSKNSELNLGKQEDNSYRVLVQGVSNFAVIKQIKDELYALGLQNISFGEVKGADVIYIVSLANGESLASYFAKEPGLVNRADYVYYYDEKNRRDQIQRQKQAKETAEKEATDAAEAEIKQRYIRENNDAPDPNQKLKTGGGVIR